MVQEASQGYGLNQEESRFFGTLPDTEEEKCSEKRGKN
jgi:hypothetical protein